MSIIYIVTDFVVKVFLLGLWKGKAWGSKTGVSWEVKIFEILILFVCFSRCSGQYDVEAIRPTRGMKICHVFPMVYYLYFFLFQIVY